MVIVYIVWRHEAPDARDWFKVKRVQPPIIAAALGFPISGHLARSDSVSIHRD